MSRRVLSRLLAAIGLMALGALVGGGVVLKTSFLKAATG